MFLTPLGQQNSHLNGMKYNSYVLNNKSTYVYHKLYKTLIKQSHTTVFCVSYTIILNENQKSINLFNGQILKEI